jgi:RimJ/RimL family protein N-acetyltransferase
VVPIPVIETPRLILRPPYEQDLDQFVALGADPEVMRYLGTGATQTPDEAERWLESILREAREGETDPPGLPGWRVATAREGGAWVGLAVLKRMNPRHEEAVCEGPLVEVGYRISQAHWGRGYATEAAVALVRFGFLTLNLPAIAGIADVRNTASNRVLGKAGLVHRKTYSLDGRNIHFHLLRRDDYLPGG